jgi:hypothetical protein
LASGPWRDCERIHDRRNLPEAGAEPGLRIAGRAEGRFHKMQ